MSQRTDTHLLTATIVENRLELTVQADRSQFNDLHGLAVRSAKAHAIRLRIPDFFRAGTAYQIYGLVLDPDDRTTILRYFEDADEGTGKECTFPLTDAGDPPAGILVIGARPSRPEVAEPRPFASDEVAGGVGLPIKRDKPVLDPPTGSNAN